MRDVETIVAAKAEQEVVARNAGDFLRLEPEQLPDAVVLVHDVVAGAEIRERLQRPAAAAALARRPLAEDLRVGQEREAELAPDEAAPSRRDREDELRVVRQLLTVLDDPRLDPSKKVLLPQRFAEVREGDDDALAPSARMRRARSPLPQARAPQGRPLRLEGERLASGKRVQQSPPSNGTGSSPSSSQTVRTSSACQTRSGPPGTGRTRSVGNRQSPCRRRERRLVQIQAALDSGIDDRGLDRMQCALGERRERAHLLDLVAPELDAKGLAARRREHVDQPAANRELAALVGALDTLVARERKRLGELLEADPSPGAIRIGWGRAFGGGIGSASAAPKRRRARRRASTSSARARSPTRCGAGSRPEPQWTPRLGSIATRSSPRNQAAPSAASRAS